MMRGDNTVLYIVVSIVVAHFIAGFAYLIYKIYSSKKK